MTYHWVVPLLAALLNACVASVVLRHNPQHALNRCFALLSATIVAWNLNTFVLYFFASESDVLYWSAVFRVGTLMAGSVVLHLMVLLSGTRSVIVWGLLLSSYAVTVFLVGANAGGYLVRGLHAYPWGFHPVGTKLYEVLPILLVFNFVLSQGVLIHILFTSDSPRQRQQAKLWIIGTLIAMPLSMTNLLPIFGIYFYPLGNLASVVYAGFIAYGIMRYRMMDTDIVITKSGAYTLVMLVVIAPAFAILLWIQSKGFGRIDIDFSAALFVFLVLVGVLSPTLRLWAETRLGRSLFRRKYEYRLTLRNFSRTIVRILEPAELIRQLASTLTTTLSVDRTDVAILDESTRVLRIRSPGSAPLTGEFRVEDPFARLLLSRRDAVLREELEASPRPEDRAVGAILGRNGWDVALPMILGPKLFGFIGLGCKERMETFSAEDLDLLATLAAQAAIALENAQLYDELRRSQEIIRRADRLSALGTLAAGIAHEINNPLVAIQTFFQLAPQRLNEHEFFNEFLTLTSEEVKRITRLISELLSFARSPTPSTSDVDLNDLLDGVIRLFEPQLRKGQITVQRDLARDLPVTRGDHDQLKQVFLNILLNAAQAIDGSGTITIATREVTHNGTRFCQVAMSDTGCGIPPSLIDDIFNPFLTTKDKGTGLGLSISNQVISEHGGFITVESQVGAGSTFRIHLRPWYAFADAHDASA
jgi:signal transduction histidine kinase